MKSPKRIFHIIAIILFITYIAFLSYHKGKNPTTAIQVSDNQPNLEIKGIRLPLTY